MFWLNLAMIDFCGLFGTAVAANTEGQPPNKEDNQMKRVFIDEYFVNSSGHPYQGSICHAAPRSSGFTFYESLLFDDFGSAAWELIFETNAPSINDLISTTAGGASLGEMFHRPYLAILSAATLCPAKLDTI